VEHRGGLRYTSRAMHRIAIQSSRVALVVLFAVASACQGKGDSGTPAKDIGKAKLEPLEKKSLAEQKSSEGKTALEKPVAKRDEVDSAGAPKEGRQFQKGQMPPTGLSNDEVYAYNKAQGDPVGGPFELTAALEGDDKLADKANGKLTAVIHTTMGDIECELFEDKAPLTVANFVGLARGVRPSYDKKGDVWDKKKFFDGVVFHRVIDGFMVQTGDPTGSGGGGPGYLVVDEIDKSLKHKSAGMMSMANRGPNTGSSQFFVTVAPTPHLDGKHAIFGQCEPKVAVEISKVKTNPANDRPHEPVSIKSVDIVRKK